MGTGHGRPSQVDQQNEGVALPLRTDLKQTDRKRKIRCKDYMDENSRLLHEKAVLQLEFERLKTFCPSPRDQNFST
ncbi:hypothetical protein SLEP1_g53023 [Rubroshorea leprosula]|uniref:Uncharacterized protein n=1 Tax=Rubroshorea leprosula TaxID=152421 RepID=A0AAV5M834_9ROSI|nr:hypothetical protein SLEP1_g53023 [Rubroshorea leprosula]